MPLSDWQMLDATAYVYESRENGQLAHIITLALPVRRRAIFKGTMQECMDWSAEVLLKDYEETYKHTGRDDSQLSFLSEATDFGSLGRNGYRD